MAGQKRLKYAQENSSHQDVYAGHVPWYKIKREMDSKVPEYLKALVDSGISPEEAMKISKGAANDAVKKGPDLKAVREAMKKIERQTQQFNVSVKEIKASKLDSDAELEKKLLAERTESKLESLKFIDGMIAEAERADPRLRKQ
eukprot:CAMPEP_0185599246 /NCGR_PEP_ID=MMETSP0434-20130131/82559_1 /TAXON_ID=626734 ORGANISM="Favella taraikaensis, Strain Fe Narragansett Bay" /NCGR_SAMPLE_ID=MMETSP0434 /ASSEMBLY_ACC=CAM_ASM_000379 /LENGTH=143 /DNA_ID=CAMNT_0028228547 /DNA_START=990 /DNA_END=1421 /DNA_ORIENTATION=-